MACGSCRKPKSVERSAPARGTVPTPQQNTSPATTGRMDNRTRITGLKYGSR